MIDVVPVEYKQIVPVATSAIDRDRCNPLMLAVRDSASIKKLSSLGLYRSALNPKSVKSFDLLEA